MHGFKREANHADTRRPIRATQHFMVYVATSLHLTTVWMQDVVAVMKAEADFASS